MIGITPRIFVTGDTHGHHDMGKLNTSRFPEQKQLTKADYVIICGDFGCVWQGDATDRYWLKWLEEKPFTTLFIDGNHENFPLLDTYAPEPWHGGMVRRIRPGILHLMRGYVFDIGGLSCFAMGGASSHDIEYRTEGVNWWPQELPSPDEYARAFDSLSRAGNRVDMVLTHCAPTHIACAAAGARCGDMLTDYLQQLMLTLKYERWYFGHYHVDREFPGGLRGIYQDVVEVAM